MRDPHGQGTKIVQAGNFHFACIDGFENSGQQADACAMAQLGVFKAQIAYFSQHGPAIGVTMGVPAGGK